MGQSVGLLFAERWQHNARINKSWVQFTIKERAIIRCASLIAYVLGFFANLAISHGYQQGAFSFPAGAPMAISMDVAIGFAQLEIIYSARLKNKEDSGHQV